MSHFFFLITFLLARCDVYENSIFLYKTTFLKETNIWANLDRKVFVLEKKSEKTSYTSSPIFLHKSGYFLATSLLRHLLERKVLWEKKQRHVSIISFSQSLSLRDWENEWEAEAWLELLAVLQHVFHELSILFCKKIKP